MITMIMIKQELRSALWLTFPLRVHAVLGDTANVTDLKTTFSTVSYFCYAVKLLIPLKYKQGEQMFKN